MLAVCKRAPNRDGVEDEYRAERDRHLFFIRRGDGTDGGNRAASTDRCTCADEECGFLANMYQVSEAEPDQHRQGDARGGVYKSRTTRVHYFVQIHAEAERDYRCLQQKLREPFAFDMKGMFESEPINQAAQKCDRRRNESACRNNDCDKKDVLAHRTSLA